MTAATLTSDLKSRPEVKAFLAAMEANPGDATTLAVAADWLEDNGAHPTAAAELREVAARLPRAWKEWEAFAKRLEHFRKAFEVANFFGVTVKSADRAIGGKERAKLTRELFAELGLKGVSVTLPTGSMCFWVNVRIPARIDDSYLIKLDPEWVSGVHDAARANERARITVERILAVAFPNHDDRGDSMTDHFDAPWTLTSKSYFDYTPARPRKPAGPKPPPVEDLDAKIDDFVEAWHENGRIGWNYEYLNYDEYERKTVKPRNKYVALDRGTSGAFLVEKATGMVWSIKAYGVPNRMLGTLEDMTAKYREATGSGHAAHYSN